MKSFALALASVLLAACGSPIVGAECRDGFTNCNGECVDLTGDPDHCGACEDSCGAFTCEESECTDEPRRDAGGDGDGDGDGDGGTSGRDGGITPIGTGNPFLPDGGLMFPDPDAGGCPIGTIQCDDRCIDVTSNRTHCGGCNMACEDEQFCSQGTCVDLCVDPLEHCARACLDFSDNPSHCGSCGNRCESGLCRDGECADAISGHVIVVGHNYGSTSSPMQRRIALNALFVQGRSPVRALMFQGDARDLEVDKVRSVIERELTRDTRSWEEIPVTADNLTTLLFRADVLLIVPQRMSDAALLERGRKWARSFAQFVARGGVIVLFDTASSNNTGTFLLLQPSGLFAAAGVTRLPAPVTLTVETPGIGVAAGSVGEYRADSVTVSFQGVTSEGNAVVSSPEGDPVVHQWVVTP